MSVERLNPGHGFESQLIKDEDFVRLYLEEISRYPLLSKEEEASLAQTIEAGQEASQLLNEIQASKKPAPDQEFELLQAAAVAQEAKQIFINSNLRLVVSIAKRYKGSNLDLLDSIQEGNIGLMHAIDKFDWRKGFKFSTYATWWIRQAITRAIKNNDHIIRLPVHIGDKLDVIRKARNELTTQLGRQASLEEIAQYTGFKLTDLVFYLKSDRNPISLDLELGDGARGQTPSTLGEIVADRLSEISFDASLDNIHASRVIEHIKNNHDLNENELKVLTLRFGLADGEPKTLGEVGECMSLSKERIRQIEAKALKKLKNDSKLRDMFEVAAV